MTIHNHIRTQIHKLFSVFFTLFFLLIYAPPTLCADSGSIRFVQISDVHYNPTRNNVKGRMVHESGTLLREAVVQINAMPDIDFVVFTGDLIDHPSEKLIEEFAGIANELKPPWFYAQGNHDVGPGGLTRKQFRLIMNRYNKYQQSTGDCTVFRGRGFLFFFMDGPVDNEITSKGFFAHDALNTMSQVLAENPDMPAAIFQHFPVVYPIRSDSHSVKNEKQYLQVLDARPNVKAVFSGHFHMTSVKERNGVAHIASPALVQFPNAFRVITMAKTNQGVTITGRLVETRLKAVQEKSKNASAWQTHYGQEKDRNFSITLK